MANRLKDKVAMIVGAGSSGPGWGNGKATAVLLARQGARVFAIDRELGLPFSWFFLMTHGHWVEPEIGQTVAAGLREQRVRGDHRHSFRRNAVSQRHRPSRHRCRHDPVAGLGARRAGLV